MPKSTMQFVLLSFLLVNLVVLTTSNIRNMERALINRLLDRNSGYDRRIPPIGDNGTASNPGPVIVRVNFYVRSIDEIDDQKQVMLFRTLNQVCQLF